VATDFDLDNDGEKSRTGADAYGFGFFPGHYAMVLLSQFPIDKSAVRTFQYFKWSDMPGAIKPIDPQTTKPFYNQQEWQALRLSSKAHWDVPVKVDGKTLHILASHPTPPVFDGPDDHNGARNHDEVRFWVDYITPEKGGYIYDDKGVKGGLAAGSDFIVMGDLNASPYDGDGPKEAILSLVQSDLINATHTPQSEAGRLNRPDIAHAKTDTAVWGARADYVLPSKTISILQSGIFWPTVQDPLYRLVEDRKASSDHRLVWVEVRL
jgi:endonuclease/exonuclease/phosphatase family metal-dependent hydrolase